MIRRTAQTELETITGAWRMIVYKEKGKNHEIVALVKKTKGVKGKLMPFVRVHSGCMTGDLFGSRHCDCGTQLHQAMRMIAQRGSGILIYLAHHEGRGIGLSNKIQAYELQRLCGLDTVQANHALGLPADARVYTAVAEILKDVGACTIALLTNNPDKERSLSLGGVDIVRRVPLETKPNKKNRAYLRVKKIKMGHMLRNV